MSKDKSIKKDKPTITSLTALQYFRHGVVSPVFDSKGNRTLLVVLPDRTSYTWLEELDIGHRILRPQSSYLFSLPRYSEVRKHNEKLKAFGLAKYGQLVWQQCVAEMKQRFILADPAYYDLLVAWVLGTYFIEGFERYAFLLLGGPAGTGKSLTGNTCIHMALNGLATTTMREASMMRLSNASDMPIFFDLTDFSFTARAEQSLDAMLTRYERGAQALRVTDCSKTGVDSVAGYSLFGPTIISTNAPLDSSALRSRGIPIAMGTGEPSKSAEPQGLIHIKEALLPLRIQFFVQKIAFQQFPDAQTRLTGGRLGQILHPLNVMFQLFHPDGNRPLIVLGNKIGRSLNEEKQKSNEGVLVAALLELRTRVAANGTLTNAEIAKTASRIAGRDIDPLITSRFCNVLGLRNGPKSKTGGVTFMWDTGLVGGLARGFGFEDDTEASEAAEGTSTTCVMTKAQKAVENGDE